MAAYYLSSIILSEPTCIVITSSADIISRMKEVDWPKVRCIKMFIIINNYYEEVIDAAMEDICKADSI